MKNFLKISIIFVFSLVSTAKAQVGIGTDEPRGVLDVNGNILLDSYLVDDINMYAGGSPYLLVRSKDSSPVGQLKLLDVSLRDVGPVNKYKLIISNVSMDQIVNLSTNLLTSKYVVAITDAVFKDAYSAKTSNGQFGSISTEVTKVIRNGNEYNAINLDFKGGTTISNVNGDWELGLVVYERELVKDWGTFEGSVSASASPTYTGTSTNTPEGLQ